MIGVISVVWLNVIDPVKVQSRNGNTTKLYRSDSILTSHTRVQVFLFFFLLGPASLSESSDSVHTQLQHEQR